MRKVSVIGAISLLVIAAGAVVTLFSAPGAGLVVKAEEAVVIACNSMIGSYDTLAIATSQEENWRWESRHSDIDRHLTLTVTDAHGAVLGRAESITKDGVMYSRETADASGVYGEWAIVAINMPPDLSLPCLGPPSAFEAGDSNSPDEPHYVSHTFLSEEEGTVKSEFWVDSNGQPTRARRTFYSPDGDVNASSNGAGVGVVDFTYSGYGEPNIITAPIATPTPLPTPTPTSVPTPTPIPTAYFYPTSDAYIQPTLASLGGASGCGTDGLWACLDEAESDGDGSMVLLFRNSALRVGFTVGSDDVPGTVVDVRFEASVKPQSGTLDAGAYGFTVYSGSEELATASGEALGAEWTDIVVADPSITSGLSSGLSNVGFQVNGPSSGPRLQVSWVRMVVSYTPTSPGS